MDAVFVLFSFGHESSEILDELLKLKFADRMAILQRLTELETKEEIDPSSEMAATIEVELPSAENEPCYTVEEARDKASQWARRSPGNFTY